MTIPDPIHELVEYEVECARADGYAQALADVAERADALDQSWRPLTRRDPEQVVAERAESMYATGIDRLPGAGQWPGLENGGVLPSADWAPSTAALTAKADQALAAAERYEPKPCRICRPPAGILCRCNGIVARPRRQLAGVTR